jgi:folylpolyglutamate synthase/dihydropteroate synthase
MPVAQLREILDGCDLQDVPITEHENLALALQAPSAQRQLVTGSLYLVGEALALLEGEASAFQASLQ